MMKELLIFEGVPCVRIKDRVSEIEAQMLKGEVWFQKDFVLQFDCRQVVGVKVVNVFDEGWLIELSL